MSRVIFHIDVNSAFLSWTAVKLMREGKPDIRLVPSVVSGDPNDRRSIITAASIPAMILQELSVVHLVYTVTGSNDYIRFMTASEEIKILCNGIRRSSVPKIT